MTARAPRDRFAVRREQILAEYRARFASVGVQMHPGEHAGTVLARNHLGCYYRTLGLVLYDDRMGLDQLRTNLEHEWTHVQLGHGGEPADEVPAREEIVDEIVARRLIPLDALARALAVGLTEYRWGWMGDAAAELEVSREILKKRLAWLDRDETDRLAPLLAAAIAEAVGSATEHESSGVRLASV